jgi:hypothetical protein
MNTCAEYQSEHKIKFYDVLKDDASMKVTDSVATNC